MTKDEEIEKIINYQVAPLVGGAWVSYTSPKAIAQALQDAGLIGEVDEYKLKKLIFPYVAKCWLPELSSVVKEIKSAIDSGEVWKK